MSQACEIAGNADLYGLGVRVGFYLQWLALLLANWLCPQEAVVLRLAITVFIAINFLATLFQLQQPEHLEDVDIYITLLFTFGPAYYVVVNRMWRMTMRFSIRWVPSRYPITEPPGLLFSILGTALITSHFVFQSWFWAARLAPSHQNCTTYGFMFGKVRLHDPTFRIINICVSILVVVVMSVSLLFTLFPKAFSALLKVRNQDDK